MITMYYIRTVPLWVEPVTGPPWELLDLDEDGISHLERLTLADGLVVASLVAFLGLLPLEVGGPHQRV